MTNLVIPRRQPIGLTQELINYDVLKILGEIERVGIDYKSIPFAKLDLSERKRTSLFPWRGQFSPELIELLLNEYSKYNDTILDPFAGSGTTIYESCRKNLIGYGVEINPAAIEMARTVHFAGLKDSKRELYIKEAKDILEKNILSLKHDGLFSFLTTEIKDENIENIFIRMIKSSSGDQFIYNIVINTIIRYFTIKNTNKDIKYRLLNAFKQHADIIRSLPFCEKTLRIYQGDARVLPIDSGIIDLVITSPPYINVFNYHQYCRSVMEIAGWNLLKIAKSEIGSNRKNRGNRFLTVIQYSIDMLHALTEMRRVINSNGKIIIIVGRESKVRGISFENYKIISILAIAGAGLQLVNRQERKFINRFGEKIYEDLLYFSPKANPIENPTEFSKLIGVFFLNEGLVNSVGDVKEDIKNAIENSSKVEESPLLKSRSWGEPYEYHAS